MDYIQRLRAFSNKEVNRAAAGLVGRVEGLEAYDAAVQLVTEWRTLHQGPVAHFRPILESKAAAFCESLVVSRLKRIPTIIAKLKRQKKGMQLSTMQDIGGLRVVVNSVPEARLLAERMKDVPPSFELKMPVRDYISHPTSFGYRGLHLVYTYRSRSEEDRNIDGLKIELQIRTRLQHIWATAVEVVGTFRNEALKSGEGSPEWLEFFRLAGDLAASKDAGGPAIPSGELVAIRDHLKVLGRLGGYNVAQWIAAATRKDPSFLEAQYYVLILDIDRRQVEVVAFAPDQFAQAVERQIVEERLSLTREGVDTVFVTADSLAELRLAYPNYFADTHEFTDLVYGGSTPDGAVGIISVAAS